MKSSYPKIQTGTLQDLKISERNKAFIKKFLDMKKGNVSPGHIIQLNNSLVKFADLIEKDFDEITREDSMIANGIMLKSMKDFGVSPRTLQDNISGVKEMYKELFGEGEEYPKVIGGLKRPKSRGTLKLPEEMLTEKQIYQAIKVCNNSRDKFLIAFVGLDGAVRKIEARNIRLGAIKKDKHGYFVVIETAKESGDKETRVIRIIKSEPYLEAWLNDYPKEKEDKDFIFINFTDHKQITDGSIEALFKRIKHKLKFKQFYPYLLRHSLLTRMAVNPNVSLAVLSKFSGHTAKSKVLSEYLHVGDKDIEEMQLKYNGIIKPKENREKSIEPIKCPRCKKMNDYDNEVCKFCSMALTQKRQVESYENLEEIRTNAKNTQKEVAELKETTQNLIKLIQSGGLTDK